MQGIGTEIQPTLVQLLLTKATVLDPRYRGSMEDAEVLDDVRQQLVQELLDMKEQQGSRAGASSEENEMMNLHQHLPGRRG